MPIKKRILCVDDHEDTCFMLGALLGQRGYEVESAGTVAEAVTLASNSRFDLHVIDLIFPDGNGIELCQRLRLQRREVPVIVYSGDVYPEERMRAMRAGADLFVNKPDISRLLEGMARLLGETG